MQCSYVGMCGVYTPLLTLGATHPRGRGAVRLCRNGQNCVAEPKNGVPRSPVWRIKRALSHRAWGEKNNTGAAAAAS